jgi:hypothetical protein
VEVLKQNPLKRPTRQLGGRAAPIDLAVAEHIVAEGVEPDFWRLFVSERELRIDAVQRRHTGPQRVGEGGVRFASGDFSLLLENRACSAWGFDYPMAATVQRGEGEPLLGCAFVTWDYDFMAFLPAIDACLGAAGEPMDVIYAAHEPGERVFVRLRRRQQYQDEGRYDCRAPREPNGQRAVLTPPDMSLRTAGILRAIFIRGPKDDPNAEDGCYEFPEQRAPDGILLGWWDEPYGC